MDSIQPIFVFGFTHSGTSLMVNILNAQGSVLKGKNETYFFDFPYLYTRKYPDLNKDTVVAGMIQFCANLMIKGYWQLFVYESEEIDTSFISASGIAQIQSELSNPTSYSEIFGKTCNYLASQYDKSAWVEKSPGHTFHSSRILSEIPDAKAIAIVRDPRDILASKKMRDTRIQDKLKQNTATDRELSLQGMIEYDPFWTSLSWRSSFRAIQTAKQNHPDSILLLNYESLVQNPEPTIRQICNFLDLEFKPEMLEVNMENVATLDKGIRVESTGIITKAIGRWKTGLTVGEAALASRLLHNELVQAGYEVESLSVKQKLSSILVLLKSVPHLVRRMLNKLKHQGWKYTLSIGKTYLNRALGRN
jgi:omega-hydroxy-beta-dihydromenaquinone-9 sulfotransferase